MVGRHALRPNWGVVTVKTTVRTTWKDEECSGKIVVSSIIGELFIVPGVLTCL